MKTSITKVLLINTLLILSMVYSPVLQGQLLEEIPNPPGFSLNFFSGGGDGDLFFDYQDINFNPTLHHYNGVDLNAIPFPPDNFFSFYSHEYNDNHYIISFDINFNSELYEYDGTTATILNLPAGLEFSYFAATYNGNMYVALNDPAFNTILYQYDGTDFFEVPSPMGLQFNNYVATLDGLMYLTYFDPTTFENQFFSFDGSSLDPVAGVPDNTSFIFLSYEGADALYLGVQDLSFNTTLYEFDGTDFIEIPSPLGYVFSFVVGENPDEGELYISYFENVNFTSSLFIYDGSSLNEILAPTDFDFPNLANIVNGTTYINMFNNISFDNALFKLNSGVLEQVDAPFGFTYSQALEGINDAGYYAFFDPSFNNVLMILDETTNSVSEVPGPMGYTFSFQATTVDNKMLLVYNDASFEQSLWIFDGTNFTQIENPPNKFFSFFMVEDLGKIYLRYDDPSNFTGTLYVLTPNSFPTSADTSVTTTINIPYFFNSDDFSFADSDPNDIFTEIMITEIEQVGFLLWDGAHVYEGDIIPFDEIENLTFSPLTDEVGSPYDAFKFKVGDGEAFSEESYIMTINVIDPNSVDNNELNAFTNVYPVPARASTTLTIESEKALDELHLRIFSNSGKLVQQKYYTGLSNSFQEVIDVSLLPVGNYFIVGKTPVGQLVKQIQIIR